MLTTYSAGSQLLNDRKINPLTAKVLRNFEVVSEKQIWERLAYDMHYEGFRHDIFSFVL